MDEVTRHHIGAGSTGKIQTGHIPGIGGIGVGEIVNGVSGDGF